MINTKEFQIYAFIYNTIIVSLNTAEDKYSTFSAGF